MEQHLTAGLGEGEIAEFIEDDEVKAREIIGEPSLAAKRKRRRLMTRSTPPRRPSPRELFQAAVSRYCAASIRWNRKKRRPKEMREKGVQMLKRALEAPTRQIAENSSVDAGVVVARMMGGKANEVSMPGKRNMSI